MPDSESVESLPSDLHSVCVHTTVYIRNLRFRNHFLNQAADFRILFHRKSMFRRQNYLIHIVVI